MADLERQSILSPREGSAPGPDRKPWQTPDVRNLDLALGTQVNVGLGSDAGAGSSHS